MQQKLPKTKSEKISKQQTPSNQHHFRTQLKSSDNFVRFMSPKNNNEQLQEQLIQPQGIIYSPKTPQVASRYRIKQKAEDAKRLTKILNFTSRKEKHKNHQRTRTLNEVLSIQDEGITKQQFIKLDETRSKDPYSYMNKLNQTPNLTNENQQSSLIEREEAFPFNNYMLIKQLKKNRQIFKITRSKQQFVNILKRNLQKLKAIGLSPKYMLDFNIFSRRPYEKANSKEFIHASKINQLDQMKSLLKKNKYLIFSYDYYNMNALHWASKKGFYDIVMFLIEAGSDTDAVDVLGRTPLYFAIQNDHYDIVRLLLYKQVYPWSSDITDLKSLLEQKPKMKQIVSEARRIDIARAMAPYTMRHDIWNRFERNLLAELPQ